MSSLIEKLEFDAPVREVYKHLSCFDSYSGFLEGVREVWPLDDSRYYWRAKVDGVFREWEAELMELSEDGGIAWRHGMGSPCPCMWIATLKSLPHQRTRLSLQVEPGVALSDERVGVQRDQLRSSLQRLKALVEGRVVAPASRAAVHAGMASAIAG